MKKNIHYLLLSCAILSFSACKKKDNDAVTPKPTTTSANLRVTGAAVTIQGNYRDNGNPDHSFFIRYFPNDEPTVKRPLIICIHGGGFIGGDKADFNLPSKMYVNSTNQYVNVITEDNLDNNGFVYASINYSLLNESNTVKNSLEDGKYFFDYIRLHADEYNIDPNKIIFIGSSGGAEMSLWIGLQPEKNAGAVKGIVALNPQASMNILKWNNDVFAPYNAEDVLYTQFTNWGIDKYNKRLQLMYGTTNNSIINAYSTNEKLHLLDLIDNTDPELYLACGSPRSDAFHAPYHVYALKQKSQACGHVARINFVDGTAGYYPTYVNPNFESVIQFCVRKFQ